MATVKRIVRKKATKINNNNVVGNNIIITRNQALNILAFAAKNGKTMKFLQNKVNAVNA